MPGIALAYRGERIAIMDTIRWTHTDDGGGDGRLILTQVAKLGSNGPLHPIHNMKSRLYPSKRKTTGLAERLFNELIARAEMSYQQRLRSPGVLTERSNWPPTQRILPIMLPAFGRMSQGHDEWRMLIGGARLALAIELFRTETGAYPDQLTDLVPEFLDELPADPFALDGAFRYKPLDTPDAAGRRYLLYSTSIDGRDDDAAHDPDVPMVPTAQKRGFDVILNVPRDQPTSPVAP